MMDTIKLKCKSTPSSLDDRGGIGMQLLLSNTTCTSEGDNVGVGVNHFEVDGIDLDIDSDGAVVPQQQVVHTINKQAEANNDVQVQTSSSSPTSTRTRTGPGVVLRVGEMRCRIPCTINIDDEQCEDTIKEDDPECHCFHTSPPPPTMTMTATMAVAVAAQSHPPLQSQSHSESQQPFPAPENTRQTHKAATDTDTVTTQPLHANESIHHNHNNAAAAIASSVVVVRLGDKRCHLWDHNKCCHEDACFHCTSPVPDVRRGVAPTQQRPALTLAAVTLDQRRAVSAPVVIATSHTDKDNKDDLHRPVLALPKKKRSASYIKKTKIRRKSMRLVKLRSPLLYTQVEEEHVQTMGLSKTIITGPPTFPVKAVAPVPSPSPSPQVVAAAAAITLEATQHIHVQDVPKDHPEKELRQLRLQSQQIQDAPCQPPPQVNGNLNVSVSVNTHNNSNVESKKSKDEKLSPPHRPEPVVQMDRRKRRKSLRLMSSSNSNSGSTYGTGNNTSRSLLDQDHQGEDNTVVSVSRRACNNNVDNNTNTNERTTVHQHQQRTKTPTPTSTPMVQQVQVQQYPFIVVEHLQSQHPFPVNAMSSIGLRQQSLPKPKIPGVLRRRYRYSKQQPQHERTKSIITCLGNIHRSGQEQGPGETLILPDVMHTISVISTTETEKHDDETKQSQSLSSFPTNDEMAAVSKKLFGLVEEEERLQLEVSSMILPYLFLF
jgi:hypothetical protein